MKENSNMKIYVLEKLDSTFKVIEKTINDDAFSDLLALPDDIQKDIEEKFTVIPWRYLFVKIKAEYVGRVVLDKRGIKVGERNYQIVGVNGLAVKKVYQQLGIGKELINHVVKLCEKEKIDAIFLNAGEDLHEYYKRFGFVARSYDYQGKSGKTYLEDDGMILILNNNVREGLLDNKFNIGVGNV